MFRPPVHTFSYFLLAASDDDEGELEAKYRKALEAANAKRARDGLLDDEGQGQVAGEKSFTPKTLKP